MWGERGRQIHLEPLDYGEDLTLEQAEDRLGQVDAVFGAVKQKYSGFWGSRKKTIADKDVKILGDAIGVLLPLSSLDSVQAELEAQIQQKEIDPSIDLEQTVARRSINRVFDISIFMARFPNSPVHVIEGSPFDL